VPRCETPANALGRVGHYLRGGPQFRAVEHAYDLSPMLVACTICRSKISRRSSRRHSKLCHQFASLGVASATAACKTQWPRRTIEGRRMNIELGDIQIDAAAELTIEI
jgi:hypothetical protein